MIASARRRYGGVAGGIIMTKKYSNQEKQEISERVVFDKFIVASGFKLENVRRGRRIDFVCDFEGSAVGIDLQSYQHDADVRKRQDFRNKIVQEAQNLYEKNDIRMLTVNLHFVDDFPNGSNIPQHEIDTIISNIISYVNKYSSETKSYRIDELEEGLYDNNLGHVFWDISIHDDFRYNDNKGKWIAQENAWAETTIADNFEELKRRIDAKRRKYEGYILNDKISECWLLIYHEGDQGSDFTLDATEVTSQDRLQFDKVAGTSPFKKIIIFDPFWSQKLYQIK